MMIVRELWREAARFPALLAGSALLLLVVHVCYAAQAVGIAWALTALGRGAGAGVVGGLLAVAAVAVVRVLAMLAQSAAAARLGGRVRGELRGRALRSALDPARLHDVSVRDGELGASLTDGIEGTDTYVAKYIPAVLQIFVACPAIAIALAWLNPWAGALVALALGGPLFWQRLMARRGLNHWDSYAALSADLLDALRGMATLRALGDVPGTRRRLHARSEGLRRATERVMRISLAETGVTDFAIQAGIVLAVMTALLQAVSADPPAFAVYLTLLLASEAFRPLRELSRHWHAGFLGLTAMPGLRRLGAFGADPAARRGVKVPAADPPSGDELAADPPVGDEPQGGAGPGGAGQLRVRGLTFTYPQARSPVFRDLNLTARRGEITAILGPSGAGKSTLFDVLLGFLEPEAGGAWLDGEPIRPDDIAVLSQRPVLFAGSIRENLSVSGTAPASPSELVEACLAAGILADIQALPGGFAAPVAEAGLSLSGGQRQRLALARALLARRAVLLVDEPTSALDAARAAEVMSALKRVAETRIVVMITHRPESLEGITDRYLLTTGHLERQPQ